MAKRMLIDATHPEETRVVVLNGNRLEEFDFESSTKRQVKGNIYLAKVTRVEPSLQAAFVEYGGNRHGFLAFSEIHADYYRIPIADRRELGTDPQPRELAAPDGAAEAADEGGVPLEDALPEPVAVVPIGPGGDDAGDGGSSFSEPAWAEAGDDAPGPDEGTQEAAGLPWEEGPPFLVSPGWVPAAGLPDAAALPEPAAELATEVEAEGAEPELGEAGSRWTEETEPEPEEAPELPFHTETAAAEQLFATTALWAAASAADDVARAGDPIAAPDETGPLAEPGSALNGVNGDAEIVETLGGDEFEEAEHQRSRAHRHYKIQEVIKRRQIMLVQVTKEERGNKGAALTTYLSLAGRYCVLMPNTARGGGVSRKITNLSDRRRLKEILEELDIPEGMGVIVRTAGAERSKAEIKRDYEYLLRLWNEIRDLTLRSTAPALIYEEGDLIKRSIRDLYTRDIDEVLVEGEDGYRTAKSFMKMLMPSHAKRVQPYRDPQIGLLHRFQVESQIDAIHSPLVQLRSGGYVVIDQTEALVAIDVNSGRSTRERNIEETALRTNLEAAEEIARQLRLRDLAGLIVIDFIDMEEHRNQGAVERKLKEALKSDRARIQVGRISPFGLLEMSRQRLRPSLVEASTQPCPHCGGTGFIRSTESTALYVLRSIEEEGMRRRSAEVCVYVPTTVALYILNNKRDSLAQLEVRYGIRVLMARDDALIPPAFRLERLRALEPGEAVTAVPAPLTQTPEAEPDEAEEEGDDLVEVEDAERPEHESEEDRVRSRRRRRRRRRHEDERARAPSLASAEEAEEPAAEPASASTSEGEVEAGDEDDEAHLRRRRGRRGGRRRGRREEGVGTSLEIGRPAADTVEIVTSDTDSAADDAVERPDGQPAAAEGEIAWPQALVDETAAPLTATGIETASLPALAGDAGPAD
ncbi:MAG TPA: Rne/Rng family ribonuclease, partial [Stellaceae bacterium]|nr:Rne/Rng family ribonuclease [Stellaceae bacterium]